MKPFGQSWRTIALVAVTALTTGRNPDKDYGGQPMGIISSDPLAADNRRSLNNTASTVANFRQAGVVLTVNKDGIGSGTVTSNPAGISLRWRLCSGICYWRPRNAFSFGK